MSTALLVLGLVILGVSFWLTLKTYKTPAPTKAPTTGGFTHTESPVTPETKDKLK